MAALEWRQGRASCTARSLYVCCRMPRIHGSPPLSAPAVSFQSTTQDAGAAGLPGGQQGEGVWLAGRGMDRTAVEYAETLQARWCCAHVGHGVNARAAAQGRVLPAGSVRQAASSPP